jgi:hypothetical protein
MALWSAATRSQMEKMRWGKGLNKSSGYSPCSSKFSSPSSRTAFDKQLHLRPSQHAGAKSTTGFLSLGWPDASYMLSPNACGLGGFTPSSRCMEHSKESQRSGPLSRCLGRCLVSLLWRGAATLSARKRASRVGRDSTTVQGAASCATARARAKRRRGSIIKPSVRT